jgi:uncharacterized paraquat-inducible protein A
MTSSTCSSNNSKGLYQLSPRAQWDLELYGWVAFTVSAIGYLVSTVKLRDYAGVAASLAFLVADACFTLVLLSKPRPTPTSITAPVQVHSNTSLPSDEEKSSSRTCPASNGE